MAFCSNCGNQISELAASCPECGHPTGRTASGTGAVRTESTAIASLVLGIAGFVVCPVVGPILAIVFGNQARTKIRNDPTLEGEPLARAGVILGWIALALGIVGIIFWVIALVVASHSSSNYGLAVLR